MKKSYIILAALLAGAQAATAENLTVESPDGNLKVTVDAPVAKPGRVTYSVTYDGRTMLDPSPLGFIASTGNYADSLVMTGHETGPYADDYRLRTAKKSMVHYRANELKVNLKNAQGNAVTVVFRVSDHDVAFRYDIPRQNGGETGSMVIRREFTGFDLPSGTSIFMTPQSDPMIGWKRTKPSYEEEYQFDEPMTNPSAYGRGYTFPALFRVGDEGWVLVSETGVDRRYCASRLGDMTGDGLYSIEFPMPKENNGNGTSAPGIALPGHTPWRTVTTGRDLAPIVETTAPWDNVAPLYEPSQNFTYGKGTWSWILWQDNSINYDDQVRFIDLASEMGYSYTLVDCGWDTNIGRERIAELARYARSKGVDLFLWYSSSGYWNDIVQSPVNIMDSSISRKKEMKWLRDTGIRGIKVDFFGGDKQETMRLYEDILSDANDAGLMVIFHGCTIPRGWERMYPNYVGSEAVLASENNIFGQDHCDKEARRSALHPFVRNTVGCMEYGGSFLNRRMAKGNNSGCVRRTTDGHSLATAVTFQNPIQNFALAPENLLPESEGGAPVIALDFMRQVPTTWTETLFIDGYPGRYVVLARKNSGTWYIAATNGTDEPMKLTLDLSRFVGKDRPVTVINDLPDGTLDRSEVKVKNPAKFPITLQPRGGCVIRTHIFIR